VPVEMAKMAAKTAKTNGEKFARLSPPRFAGRGISSPLRPDWVAEMGGKGGRVAPNGIASLSKDNVGSVRTLPSIGGDGGRVCRR
jgi:hypothetical protein